MAKLSNINGLFAVESTGAIKFNDQPGTVGQLLKSNGNTSPTWVDQSTIVGAYLPLAGGVLTGATSTASGISFTVGGTLTVQSGNKLILNRPNNAIDCELSTDASGTLILNSRNGEGFKFQNNGTNFVTGDSSNQVTFAGNVILGDTPKIQLGTGNDAQIDHTGSHLFIDNSVGNSYLRNTSTGSIIIRNSTGGDIQFDNEFAGNILFNTSNITRLTIDSSGNATFASTVDGQGFRTTSGSTDYSLLTRNSANTAVYIQQAGTGNIVDFRYGSQAAGQGTSAMVIDDSGNVGISSTVPEKNLSIGSAQGDGIQFNYDTTNSYRNQILNYWNSSPDSRMDFNIGRTANVAPVTVMSVGYSGNVGIGTTTPSSKLSISGSQAAIDLTRGTAGDSKWGFSSDSARLYIAELSTGSTDYIMTFTESSGNVGIGITNPTRQLSVLDRINIKASSTSGSANLLFGDSDDDGIGQIKYDNSDNSMRFQVNNGERMRITSAGHIEQGIVGTTASAYYYFNGSTSSDTGLLFRDNTSSNSGFLTYNHSVDAMKFGTGGSEKMRITSAGDVLMGGFAANAAISPTLNGFGFTSSGTGTAVCNFSDVNEMFVFNQRDGQGTTQIDFRNGNVERGKIQWTTSGTTYNTASDYRVKENLKDFNGLNKVSKIKVYDFDWIESKKQDYGVIAHELQEILPLAVTGEKDGEKMQGVDYSKIVPLLVKSIQELKAEIEILKNK